MCISLFGMRHGSSASAYPGTHNAARIDKTYHAKSNREELRKVFVEKINCNIGFIATDFENVFVTLSMDYPNGI